MNSNKETHQVTFANRKNVTIIYSGTENECIGYLQRLAKKSNVSFTELITKYKYTIVNLDQLKRQIYAANGEKMLNLIRAFRSNFEYPYSEQHGTSKCDTLLEAKELIEEIENKIKEA